VDEKLDKKFSTQSFVKEEVVECPENVRLKKKKSRSKGK